MPHEGSSVSRAYPWMWSVPAVTLTFASFVVFLFVYGYILSVPITRSKFYLPFFDGDWGGVPVVVFGSLFALLLTLWMTWKLRSRPKLLLAKAWLIFLGVVSVLGIIVSAYHWSGDTTDIFSVPVSVWAHTTLFAVVSALCVLFFRLRNPLPDSKWIQRAAPIAILVVLPLILLTVLLSEQYTEGWIIDLVKEEIKPLEVALAEAEKNPDYRVMVTGLGTLDDLIETATKLPNQDGLQKLLAIKEKFTELKQKLVKELDPDELEQRTITYHNVPVIGYDFNQIVYRFNAEAADKYSKNARYFKGINEALISMENLGVGGEYKIDRDIVRGKLENVINNWSDRWIAFLLPEVYGDKDFNKTIYVNDLISKGFLSLEDTSGVVKQFSLASLEDLLTTNISVRSAEQYAQKNGCYQGELFNRGRYFAIVCQAYMSDSQRNVFPLLSIRVVYTRAGTPFEIAIIMPEYKDAPMLEINLDRDTFLDSVKAAPRNASSPSVIFNDFMRARRYYENNIMYYSRITLSE